MIKCPVCFNGEVDSIGSKNYCRICKYEWMDKAGCILEGE